MSATPNPARCPCVGDDAAAANAARATPWLDLVDESHFSVRLARCTACGRPRLSIFAELIDWSHGDDSQARILIPLAEDEAAAVASTGHWQPLLAADRRHLVKSHPRGGEAWIGWCEGPVVIPPHD
jgi:hypothetical protein